MADDDIRDLVRRSAAVPAHEAPLAPILERASRRRARRRGAAALAVVALLGAVVVAGLGAGGNEVEFIDTAPSEEPNEAPTEATEPTEPAESAEPEEPEAAVEPEGMEDADVLATEPGRAVAGMLRAPACQDAGGLPDWTATGLGGAAADFAPVEAAQLHEALPLLRTAPSDGTCLVAGSIGDAQAWELRDAAGVVLGRLGSAPVDEADIPFEELFAADAHRNESTIGSGQDFFGQAEGERIDGYMRMGMIEQDQPLPPARRLLGELPGIPTERPDLHDQGSEHLRAMVLAHLVEHQGTAIPARMIEGFVRCAGPYRQDWTELMVTAFCDEDGQAIELTGPVPLGTGALVQGIWVDEPPGVPVQIDGRQGERVDRADGRYELVLRRGTVPGYELRASASAALPQDQVAAVLASTEPDAPTRDMRAEPADEEDPVDHRDAFDAAWVQQLLEQSAGAENVRVTRSRSLDPGWQQVSSTMSAADGPMLITVAFTYPRGTIPTLADATCGGVGIDILGHPGKSFEPDVVPPILDGFLERLGCTGP